MSPNSCVADIALVAWHYLSGMLKQPKPTSIGCTESTVQPVNKQIILWGCLGGKARCPLKLTFLWPKNL